MIFTFEYRGKRYEFDDEKMGLGEARWVKAETGLFGTKFFDAIRGLDPDALACMVVLAMKRAGAEDADLASVCEDANGYFHLIETVKAEAPPANRAERRAVAKRKTTPKKPVEAAS